MGGKHENWQRATVGGAHCRLWQEMGQEEKELDWSRIEGAVQWQEIEVGCGGMQFPACLPSGIGKGLEGVGVDLAC